MQVNRIDFDTKAIDDFLSTWQIHEINEDFIIDEIMRYLENYGGKCDNYTEMFCLMFGKDDKYEIDVDFGDEYIYLVPTAYGVQLSDDAVRIYNGK